MAEEEKVEQTPSPTEEAPSQEKDPVEQELARIDKSKRSKLEKLEYTRERVDKQIAEERAKAGITDDEDRPMTVREFKALRTEEQRDTAVSLANAIENEAERRLVQYHLENTIRPSGDAKTDLDTALAIVQGVKNRQKAEEALRASPARSVGSAASAPPKEVQTSELTPTEEQYMKSFKLTKEQVLAARPKG